MKRPFIYALAIAMFSLLFYISCSKGNETVLTENNTSSLILPDNAIGRFCFDGNLGVIGYKTNDSTNRIINFDTTNFTVSYGDTLFKCSHFRIHHDMDYPGIAYLTFSGIALHRSVTDEKVYGKFAIDLSYSGPGVPAQRPVKKKVEHKCESYTGLLDFIFACSCCDMVYEQGQVVGCDCVCGFMGGCIHTKTITDESRPYGGGAFAETVYKRIIQK